MTEHIPLEVIETFKSLGAVKTSVMFWYDKNRQIKFGDIVYFWNKDDVELGYWTVISDKPMIFHKPRIWGEVALSSQIYEDLT